MKVTKAKTKSFLKSKLATDSAWALRALVRVYEFQTQDEQSDGQTRENNSVGFSGFDAEILSSFATQYQNRGSLSPKQMALVFKKMPKYHAQIRKLIPEETLKNWCFPIKFSRFMFSRYIY